MEREIPLDSHQRTSRSRVTAWLPLSAYVTKAFLIRVSQPSCRQRTRRYDFEWEGSPLKKIALSSGLPSVQYNLPRSEDDMRTLAERNHSTGQAGSEAMHEPWKAD